MKIIKHTAPYLLLATIPLSLAYLHQNNGPLSQTLATLKQDAISLAQSAPVRPKSWQSGHYTIERQNFNPSSGAKPTNTAPTKTLVPRQPNIMPMRTAPLRPNTIKPQRIKGLIPRERSGYKPNTAVSPAPLYHVQNIRTLQIPKTQLKKTRSIVTIIQ